MMGGEALGESQVDAGQTGSPGAAQPGGEEVQLHRTRMGQLRLRLGEC